jgi:hypothetical protein
VLGINGIVLASVLLSRSRRDDDDLPFEPLEPSTSP